MLGPTLNEHLERMNR